MRRRVISSKGWIFAAALIAGLYGSVSAGSEAKPAAAKPLSSRHAAAAVADGSAPAASRPAASQKAHASTGRIDRVPNGVGGAPPNDECSGAIPIPAGALPVQTAPVDISNATPQDVEDPDVCPSDGTFFGMDRNVWYSFTPTTSGYYVFSTCADSASGSTVYDTVVGVFDACPGTANTIECNDRSNCNANLPGFLYSDQAIAKPFLNGGHTYYIAVGHWFGDTGGVHPGNNQVALFVNATNDSCASPLPIELDRITFGSTLGAHNDYESPLDCFHGEGQLPTLSDGPDLVYSFKPPDADLYSFRYVQDATGADLRSQSPVLYLADNCPDANPTTPITGCISAANRMNDQTTGNGNRSEEINCVPLDPSITYYLFFDQNSAVEPGGDFAIEVTRCKPEVEPNDTTATATPFSPNSACFMEGSSKPSGPTGDIDFYDLGAPPAGSKIFVAIDSAASGNSDYEMRITNATDTLGYDDNDGSSWIGSNAPVIAGPFADGSEIYARVDSKPTNITGNEPYRLYARVETGAAQEESLPDPNPDGIGNDFVYEATHVTEGGFVKGVIYAWDINNGPLDIDCFKFVLHEGDELTAFSDNNPSRTAGTIGNVWPVLVTLDGAEPANFRFGGQVLRNNVTPSPGTLTGVTPSVTSQFLHYRARYTGMHALCFQPTPDVNTNENPAPGAYPLPYQGSISVNCGPVPPPGAADVSIALAVSPGPHATGSLVDYTITVTNEGPDVAQDVRIVDTLPPGLLYTNLAVVDGFGGGDTVCLTLPTAGQNDLPLDCTNYSIAPGATVTYTLTAQIENCSGAGVSIENDVSMSAYTADANPGNDTASTTLTTSDDGTCQILLCDPISTNTCIIDHCQANGHCDESGSCVTDTVNCDDNNVCTDDFCDSTRLGDPCVHDSSQEGDLCSDGNDCTFDLCDPVNFCVFPPTPAGTPCSDFQNCTTNDACDGAATCVGHSVCDDGNPCTDDFADEANNCACDNPISFPGTPCDDGNPCTTGTTCDGTGGTVAACNTTNGGGPTNCDDGNPCTDDSCDPVTGCVHVNNTAACDDGNACTSGDTCGGGTCNPGPATVCDDGNPCTDDSCNPASGCVHTNNTGPCSDGNACTVGDVCVAGACVPGAPVVCNDNNPCTDDACNPASGCVHTNNTAPCSDGSACTVGDTCAAGVCVPGAPAECDDANPCTDDSCNPASGCVHVNNTAPCSDGSVCTTGDTCAAGVCVPGPALGCDDHNVCTTDTCDPIAGCVHTNNTNACDDGNSCTTGDTCANGACAGIPAPEGTSCDDGDACTTGETCIDVGVCGGGSPKSCDDGNPCTADECDSTTGCFSVPANFASGGFSADRIDGRDLEILAAAWNACTGGPTYDPQADLDGDGCVDMADFHFFMTTFGQTCP